jgi:predicted outer membrane repeat protein
MNRFLAALASRARAIVTPGNCEKRGLPHPGQKFAHQRGLKLEPLEERTLLSASWDEPKASTIYVDDSAVGLNNGTSWANAYNSLQAALSAAVSGDQIRVAQGTYRPTADTDRTKSFPLKSDVAIYGGYAGYGAPNPDARAMKAYSSILSGDIATVGDNSDNSYHVVYGNGASATAILDGFTITGGNANGTSSNSNGGGLYNNPYAVPTVTNCVFVANSATGSGGGIYIEVWGGSKVTNCVFVGNYAGTSGGGLYEHWSSSTLTNCIFAANTARVGGGAILQSQMPPSGKSGAKSAAVQRSAGEWFDRLGDAGKELRRSTLLRIRR